MFSLEKKSMSTLLLGLLAIAPICDGRARLIEMCDGKSSPVRLSEGNKVIIQSPGYPRENSETRQCELLIEANTEFSQIEMKCTRFLLMDLKKRKNDMQKNRKNICKNYLQINNKKFCGIKGPNLITSENKTVIRFVSNKYEEGSGFSCYAKLMSTKNKTCECGQEKNEPRIVDGVESYKHYPWMAGILKFPRRYRPSCGGSLINDRWVLSAAHCFSLEYRIFPGLVTVLLNERTIGVEDGETRHAIKLIIIHPKWYHFTKGYDIALLELSEPINFKKSKIRPVCFPTAGKAYENTTAKVMGWGKTSWDDTLSEVLMEVTIPTITNEECSLLYQGINMNSTVICAGYSDKGKGICRGDSGGPMITQEDGHYVQIGIASFGRAQNYDDDGCSAAAGYTRVTAVLDWILDNTAGANTCPP